MDCRVLGVGVERDAQTDRRPARGDGIEMGQRVACGLRFGFEPIHPQIERRAARQRLALGYSLLAEHASEMGIEPLRIVARDPGRGAGEVGCREPRPLLRAQRRRRKAPTVGARRDRVAIELALEPQHAEDRRARALVAHDVGARGPPAQRIVNQPRDRRAIGRAGEAVHQAPILERVGGRAPARFDIGDDLDGGGEAGAGRHQIPTRIRIMKINHMTASTSAPRPKTGPRRRTSLSVMWM